MLSIPLPICQSSTSAIRRSLVDYENPWHPVVLLCYHWECVIWLSPGQHISSEANVQDLSLVKCFPQLGYSSRFKPKQSLQLRVRAGKILPALVVFHCLLEIASGSIKEWTAMARRNVFSWEALELVYCFFLDKGTFLGSATSTMSSDENVYLTGLEWPTEIPTIVFLEVAYLQK
ncbi:hypothetical protein BDW75DRAFT_238404 [Aspergillus navahoensis]